MRKMTDSRGRMKERKVSQEGKKNKRLLQHAKVAWKRAGEAESRRQGDLTLSQVWIVFALIPRTARG